MNIWRVLGLMPDDSKRLSEEEWDAHLVARLQKPLGDLGFKDRQDLEFKRPSGQRTESIAVGGTLKLDDYEFSAGAGIIFHELQLLINPEPDICTVGGPLHILGGHPREMSWKTHHLHRLDGLCDELIDAVKQIALAWFSELESIECLEEKLNSGWLYEYSVLPYPDRDILKLALAVHRRHRESVTTQVSDFLAKDKRISTADRRRYEEFLTRIRESSPPSDHDVRTPT